MDRRVSSLHRYIIAVVAVGCVFLIGLAGRGGLHPAVDDPGRFILFVLLLFVGEVFPIALAALVFYVLNTVITDIAIALSSDIPLLPYLARDLVFQAYVGPPLLALSPVVIVAAEASLWLMPLLLVPAYAVYRGTRLA